jgi:hypothetical protein
VLLAGCGKAAPASFDLGPCGMIGERCCDGDQCGSDIQCVAGFCQAIPCGEEGGPCCAGGCKALDLVCDGNLCHKPCGQLHQPCCMFTTCTQAGTACTDEQCEIPPGATGAPCTFAGECTGLTPICLTKGPDGLTWPYGYCMESCDSTHNDPMTGINPDCPGIGVCLAFNMEGRCFALCTALSGTMPCRASYSCFETCASGPGCIPFCEPEAESQCNPTVSGSCESGMDCVRTGIDNVGVCMQTCDLFRQNCDQSRGPMACYVVDDTGRGFCEQPFGVQPNGDGGVCLYPNDCRAGLTCFQEGLGSVCRPFCGGPMNVPCSNGKSCVDLSAKVKVAVVGVCGG